MAAIFYFSSRPDPLAFVGTANQVGSLDPLIHFLEYLGLPVLLYNAVHSDPSTLRPQQQTRPSLKRQAIAAILAAGYAISDELHQGLVSGRSFQMVDLAYDAMGIGAAAVSISLATALRRNRSGGP